MSWVSKISITFLVFIGGFLCFQALHHCERFEPESELYFYADTVVQISRASYTFFGALVNVGDEAILEHGFCWSDSESPSIEKDSLIALGPLSEAIEFSHTVTDLRASNTYVVRAYIETKEQVSYSDEMVFETPAPGKPIVSTNDTSNVSQTTVKCGGNVLDEGGASVTAKGVCWSQSPEPEITDSFTVDGSGPGSYPSEIIGLTSGIKYYVRAYATNSAGTGYGEERIFTTLRAIVRPTVSTLDYSNLTETTVQSGGNVTDEGGGVVHAKGICWSKSPDPDINDSVTVDGEGLGGYTSVISGLSCNVTYFLRAFATNSAGTAYGDPIEFRTDVCTSLRDIDKNEYELVKIGDQIWMAENLKVTHYPDGRVINYVADSAQWTALGTSSGAYCWYENVESNSEIYGALYNWTAAMNGEGGSYSNPSGIQGVCPDGWHLPSDDEWKQLEVFLGMSQSEADKAYWRGTDQGVQLKEKGFVHWQYSSDEGTNSRDFNALPAGDRHYHGYFEEIGRYTYFWTTTEYNTLDAWDRHLSYREEGIHRKNNDKGHGFSIRCVMDD